jgi:hypothetical protein
MPPHGCPVRVSAPSAPWVPPPSEVTHPDQLPGEAWYAFDLIDGETVLNVWRTARGYLVLTNLRCLGIRLELDLFAPKQWRSGPEFFFYNLNPPTVRFDRIVELSEQVEESGAVGRFAVQDPEGVANAISAALDSGRETWRTRRQKTQEMIHARQRLLAQRTAGAAHPVYMVRCSYCGNLANASLPRCPSCGATLD